MVDQPKSSFYDQIAQGMFDPEQMAGEIAAQRDARPDVQVPFVAPRTPTEEKTAAIVAEVLGLERVGVYDDFYALGGDSINATQVLLRIRDAMQVELPMRIIVAQTFTVEKIAEAIEECQAGGETASLSDMVAQLEGLSDADVEREIAAVMERLKAEGMSDEEIQALLSGGG